MHKAPTHFKRKVSMQKSLTYYFAVLPKLVSNIKYGLTEKVNFSYIQIYVNTTHT